jgi:hypothetical protein
MGAFGGVWGVWGNCISRGWAGGIRSSFNCWFIAEWALLELVNI